MIEELDKRKVIGIPHGRVIEVIGKESDGTTTLTLHVVASVQKQGGLVAFIDADNTLDPCWVKQLGVELENLIVSQPDSDDEALDIAKMLVESNGVDMIVLDSVPVHTSKKVLRELNAVITKGKPFVIVIVKDNKTMTDESNKRKTGTKHVVPRVCITCHVQKLGIPVTAADCLGFAACETCTKLDNGNDTQADRPVPAS
jgi:RecA/RadA recombinase